MALQHLLLLASCATAFVAPGRGHGVGRVAPSHAIDASTLSDSMLALARVAPPHAFDASTVSTLSDVSMTLDGSSLAMASFQDLRDSIADVVRPFAILAAVPAFGIALIPVTLAAALARAAAVPAARVAEVLESIPAEEYQKLLLCIAFDAAGDLSESLPFHGLLELALGPLDYFVLRYLFEDSFAIPVAGLLEEWLPIPVEFLPTATLAWCVQNLAAESEIARKLGLVKKK